MDEKESSVVATAAATLSRDKFLRPLRALCVHKVAQSLKFYVDSGITSLHSYLLPKLCEEVFLCYVELWDVGKRHFCGCRKDFGALEYKNLPNNELLKIASLFVDADMKEFDTTVLGSPDKDRGLESWKPFFNKLLEGAPKLASFHFGYASLYGSRLPPSHYISFGQMPFITTLEISNELIFTNADLQVVGTSLPLLRYLYISIHGYGVTTTEGLIHLQQLKMLEHFSVILIYIGALPGPEELEVVASKDAERIEFCLLTMPKLKVTGYKVQDFLCDIGGYHSFSVFEKKEEPLELGLEHLKLSKDLPPANVLLPHVTHFEVDGSEALNYCLGRSFPKLKVLLVSEVSFKDLEKLLQHLGHPLDKLFLQTIEGLCDLLLILKLCPQLDCLHFDEKACVKDIGSFNPWIVSTQLAKITNFQMLSMCDVPEHSYCNARGLLKLLMISCPDLKLLRFDASIPQAEVDEVAAGIAAGTFLCIPKLQGVTIVIQPEISNQSMLNFVEQVVAHCPKLVCISGDSNFSKSKLSPLKDALDKYNRGHILNHYINKEY